MRLKIKFLFLAAISFAVVASSSAQTQVEVKKAGTLGQLLTQAQQDTCSALVLSGKLNAEDLKVLRRMAGFKEEGHSTGRLAFLDLDKCKMKKSKEPFMVLDAAKEFLAGTGKAAWEQFNDHVNMSSPYRRTTSRYDPMFILGHRSDKPVQGDLANQELQLMYGRIGGTLAIPMKFLYPAEGDFHFDQGLTEEEWENLKRMGLRKGHGYEIIREGSRYTLHLYTRKNRFSQAAFYKCPHLKALIFPRTALIEMSVQDPNSRIHFMQGKKLNK